ncbi:hypothetical protein PV371_33370 [Streptomyces sp. TX20-6-3]|uniref:hypothetical protein n=1 Tax=Streptomyces sp. TX20-6-3 TaxID=3028705 RepID=UPI0029B16064|nr:hypothetical protein [Streptomyces sp. TX20-6-3]MDX2564517.1 hypothetical protein [Streptomyces sp. TX20-6-3]
MSVVADGLPGTSRGPAVTGDGGPAGGDDPQVVLAEPVQGLDRDAGQAGRTE